MTQLALYTGSESRQSLICGLTPSGQILVRHVLDAGQPLQASAAKRIAGVFSKGRGHGVLHLGVAELTSELDPTLGFWRDLGQSFVAKVCAALDPTEPNAFVAPDPEPDELDALAHAAPPMQGAELVSSLLLAEVWADMGEALAQEAGKRKDGIQGYLQARSSWHCFRLYCARPNAAR